MLHNPSYDFNDELIPLGGIDVGAHRRSAGWRRSAGAATACAGRDRSRPDAPAVAAPRKKSFLDTVERVGNRLPDPVLIFVWLIVAVIVLSAVGAAAGWAAVNPVTQATLSATSLLVERATSSACSSRCRAR